MGVTMFFVGMASALVIECVVLVILAWREYNDKRKNNK